MVKLTTLAGGAGPKPRLDPKDDKEASDDVVVDVYRFLPETLVEESDRTQRMGMISSSRCSEALRERNSGVGAAGLLAARVSFWRIRERRDVALFAGVVCCCSAVVGGWLVCGGGGGGCCAFMLALLRSCSRCAPLLRNAPSASVYTLISSFGKLDPWSLVIAARN